MPGLTRATPRGMDDAAGELLRVERLGVDYGPRTALDGVSFAVGPGELVAVIGPNGSGKSTMFKAIAGLVAHRGEVILGGVPCAARGRHLAAFVPQRADVDHEFPITVAELVALGRRRFTGPFRRLSPLDRAAVADAIEQVGLRGRERSVIGSLSGGQLQRAFLARALVQGAELLLLDEAMSGVDQAATAELMALFSALTGEGVSLLIATHDLALARRRFSRCLAINGALVADGPPGQVLIGGALEATFGSGEPRPRAEAAVGAANR
ncbi:MAG: metal ABC transporter ATP-binding protein [Acidimicrobiales bacterium]